MSENDLERTGQQSHTVEEAGNTNSAGAIVYVSPQIDGMKTEVMKYQALPASITSFQEKAREMTLSTLCDWCKSNCAMLPAFAYVLRAVLSNSPNSCPPERLLSKDEQACSL